jgi:hypothetical protein
MQEACLEADRKRLSLTASPAEPASHPGFGNSDYVHKNSSYGSYAHENDERPGDCGSTSARSTGFCAIWVCINFSSSWRLLPVFFSG